LPKAQINGFTLHYQQMGTGADVVMIHGLFSNLAFWYFGIMANLAGRHRVTAYDLRGHGYSDVPASGYTSADMAADLGALLDQLGIERAHLVAHSFGGSVALQYSLQHPERILSLTLADVWVPSLQSEPLAWNSATWREAAVKAAHQDAARAGDLPENLPRVAYDSYDDWLRLQDSSAGGGFDAWVEGALQKQWNSDSRVAERWFQLVRTTSAVEEMRSSSDLARERIGTVTCPTLAIFGEYSGCLETLRGLEKYLPACRTVMVPGVGHLHPLLRPKIFLEHVTQFIGSATT
jgi:pimeloyl-ACP methyl ester carboxylesterase